MSAFPSFRRLGCYFYVAVIVGAQGQDTVSSSPIPSTTPSVPAAQVSLTQTTLQAFQSEQQTLAQSFSVMLTLHPTAQQVQAWQTQNAAALANQQKLALNMAAISAAQPMPFVTDVYIPDDATPEMEAFLTNQATLANNFAQLHNQNSGASEATTTAAFQQQNATLLQQQGQLAQTLAAQSAQRPLPVPPPLVIPPNATPQLAAFLTARDQLARAQIQLQNQYVTATPSVRDAALQQWQQQNAAQTAQLNQLAQNLANTPTN